GWARAVRWKSRRVGSLCPFAGPGVGAIATQSFVTPRYGPDGLRLLKEGLPADVVVERLTAADEGRAHRQLGIVDGQGRAATYTGDECFDWAGGRSGDGYAAQGNILVSEATVDGLADTFERTAGKLLADRLLDSLGRAQAAGGDSRGQQSASLLVVEKDAGYARLSDIVVDLRVDDHERPLEELRRIFAVHEQLFGKTPAQEWIDVDAPLASELSERLARLGYDGDLDDALRRWAGNANLEERVDGAGRIDPVVLQALRRAA